VGTLAAFLIQQLVLYFKYRISNKEYRTAEVFESRKKMFFTSIFCGSLFCGSAVYILKDLIGDGLMQSADRRDLILRFCSTSGPGQITITEASAFMFFFLTPDT